MVLIIMKRLLTVLFLGLSLNGFATHFTFGTPGSTATLISMSGHSAGDTAYIAPGTYTTPVFKNLTGIVIMALDTLNWPIFTIGGSWNSNTNCQVAYLKFIYGSGTNICIQMNGGRNAGNIYHHLFFSGWASSVFTNHNNVAYTYGDHTTSVSDQETWHDIIIDSCGQFLQGSFGNPGNGQLPVDVFTATTIYNIQDIATSLQGGNGQGTGIRGVFFELTVHDCF